MKAIKHTRSKSNYFVNQNLLGFLDDFRFLSTLLGTVGGRASFPMGCKCGTWQGRPEISWGAGQEPPTATRKRKTRIRTNPLHQGHSFVWNRTSGLEAMHAMQYL
jgi:hypothetical protein